MATLTEALESISDTSIRHIVSISGGKDSAALAIYLRKNYPDIPAEYVFCDTMSELPETNEFIERLEALLGVEVKRLTAMDGLGVSEKAGKRTPFDIFLNELYGGFLPSPRSRWCTRALKIEPFERYLEGTRSFSYIGIRADENRDGYQSPKKPVLSQKPNIIPVYPFKDDGIRISDVKKILEESGLGLPDYYRWRSRSGCYFCFYQQIGEWQRLQEEHPELFRKAMEYEKTVNGKQFTWVEGRTLEEISKLEKRYPVQNVDETSGCAICHL